MDTTLRDGEQTSGVSFSIAEKLALSKLLLNELNVDRIEIASARVSDGELKAVQEVSQWAQNTGLIQRIEILTFVDGGTSIDWMVKSGAKVQNLLTKGSLNHLKHQLKKTPDQHFKAIEEHVLTAQKEGISTNIYLEDWSNGMRNSQDYVNDYLTFVSTLPIKRVLLPDTLGVMTYYETFSFISEVVKSFPEIHFDFHGHNDYDLSVPNAIEAVRAGCHGLHLTVNGMGERAGNTPMASTVANLKDFLHDVEININESSLYKVSKLVATFTGFRIPANKPIVGQNVFTQTAGIHADGDKKKNLYFNDLLPERFGRTREYALGKTSGRANIQKNLQKLGINLNDDEIKKVTQRIIELGDKKEIVTTEDLPFIISDILNSNTEQKVSVKSYVLTHAKGLQPNTVVSLDMEGEVLEENAAGDGQFDAFMNALKKIYRKKKMTLAKLTDYAVRIPPGSNSDALCETLITWKNGEKEFITRGLDSDQTVSAIKATEKMLNIISS
jgi:D-citramalate synthase